MQFSPKTRIHYYLGDSWWLGKAAQMSAQTLWKPQTSQPEILAYTQKPHVDIVVIIVTIVVVVVSSRSSINSSSSIGISINCSSSSSYISTVYTQYKPTSSIGRMVFYLEKPGILLDSIIRWTTQNMDRLAQFFGAENTNHYKQTSS